MGFNEIRWTIRLDEMPGVDESHWHVSIVRSTEDTRYQADADRPTKEEAIDTALQQIKEVENNIGR